MMLDFMVLLNDGGKSCLKLVLRLYLVGQLSFNDSTVLPVFLVRLCIPTLVFLVRLTFKGDYVLRATMFYKVQVLNWFIYLSKHIMIKECHNYFEKEMSGA